MVCEYLLGPKKSCKESIVRHCMLQPFSAHLEHCRQKKKKSKSYYRLTTLIVYDQHIQTFAIQKHLCGHYLPLS